MASLALDDRYLDLLSLELGRHLFLFVPFVANLIGTYSIVFLSLPIHDGQQARTALAVEIGDDARDYFVFRGGFAILEARQAKDDNRHRYKEDRLQYSGHEQFSIPYTLNNRNARAHSTNKPR